jgi:hypothetical protein
MIRDETEINVYYLYREKPRFRIFVKILTLQRRHNTLSFSSRKDVVSLQLRDRIFRNSVMIFMLLKAMLSHGREGRH